MGVNVCPIDINPSPTLCLNSGLDIFLKRSVQTSIVNSYAVAYKPIAPTDNPAGLQFNCSGHSDYYIYLNSLRLLLSIKFFKTRIYFQVFGTSNRLGNSKTTVVIPKDYVTTATAKRKIYMEDYTLTFFNFDKILINAVDMNIKLTRAQDAFNFWPLKTTTKCLSKF